MTGHAFTRRALLGGTAAAGASLLLTSPARAADISRIAIIGDSTVTGYGVWPWQSWVSRLEARAPGQQVWRYGINGATTRRWLQQHLGQLNELLGINPRTIAVCLGGNEYHQTRPAGEYADHLHQFGVYLHNLVPAARLVFVHYYRIEAEFVPTGCDAPPGDTTPCLHQDPPHTWDDYGMAMAWAAGRVGAGYVDVSHTRDWSRYLLPDQAHLTAEGHRLFEQDVTPRLMAA